MLSSDPERQNIILHCLKSTDACKFIRGAVPRRRLKKSWLPTWPFIHRKLSLSANHPPKPRQVFAVEVKTSRAAFQTKKDPTCFPTTNGKNRNYLNRIPIFLNRQDFFVPLTGNRSDERRSGKRSGCRPDLGTPGGPVRHLGLVSVPALCRNVQLSFHSSCRVEQTRCDQRSLAASGSVSIWMGDRFRQILHIWAHHCWLCFVFRSSQP